MQSYCTLDSDEVPHEVPYDDEVDEVDDESDETSMQGISWILALHFFAAALTVPALPSLLLDIMHGDILLL